jgi:hypothetical protein
VKEDHEKVEENKTLINKNDGRVNLEPFHIVKEIELTLFYRNSIK